MSVQPVDLNDPALVTEVDLARAAAQEEAGDEPVGAYVSHHIEDEAAVTHLFEADKPGYHGWRWAVTVASAGHDTDITVSEVVLLPGPSALVAPEWIPWQNRVQAGDLGVGDLLPTSPDDPRLVPAYLESDDEAVEEVAMELGLGRPRVMARPARLEAAARWQESEFGPRSDMARSAPAHCGTCGFYLPLAGALRASFGTCGNEISPADGHVVHTEYGCGAHSEAEVEQVSPVLVANLIYDDALLDVEPLEIVDEVPATEPTQGATTPEPATDEAEAPSPEATITPVADPTIADAPALPEQVAEDAPAVEPASAEAAVAEVDPEPAEATPSVEPANVEAVVVEVAPIEEAPPAEPTSPEAAVVEDAPVEEAPPVGPASSEAAVVEDAPIEDAPLAELTSPELAVSADAPVEDAPPIEPMSPEATATEVAPIEEAPPVESAGPEAAVSDAAPIEEARPVESASSEAAAAETVRTEPEESVPTSAEAELASTEAPAPSDVTDEPSPASPEAPALAATDAPALPEPADDESATAPFATEAPPLPDAAIEEAPAVESDSPKAVTAPAETAATPKSAEEASASAEAAEAPAPASGEEAPAESASPDAAKAPAEEAPVVESDSPKAVTGAPSGESAASPVVGQVPTIDELAATEPATADASDLDDDEAPGPIAGLTGAEDAPPAAIEPVVSREAHPRADGPGA